MSGWFQFGQLDSTDYDLLIFEKAVDRAPMWGQSAQEVPGRNGELLIPTQRMPNVERIYTAVIVRDIENNIRALRNALATQAGYQRLTDSWGTGEYYVAYAPNEFQPILARNRKMVKIELSFTRKPQRFLTLGETAVTFTSSGSIGNPTNFEAAPLIRIYGAGELTIGDTTIEVTQAGTAYTDIDCDIMECYEGADSRNAYVEISSNDFPRLKPGSNGIELGAGISKVEITPRWWRV